MKLIDGIEYLKIADVAKKLNVSRNTVYAWVQKGKLKPINPGKWGREYLFDEEELERFMYS